MCREWEFLEYSAQDAMSLSVACPPAKGARIDLEEEVERLYKLEERWWVIPRNRVFQTQQRGYTYEIKETVKACTIPTQV